MSAKLKEPAELKKIERAGNPKLAALLRELYRHMQRDAKKERTGCG